MRLKTIPNLTKIILILCLTLSAINQAWAQSKWIANDAPGTYLVRKGDTLWDIAEKFLNEPWQWPKLWAGNPHISNPHLIYPGDRISLTYDQNGNPRFHLEKRGSRTYWEGNQRVVNLSPKIRSDAAEGAIPTVPINVIKPFFNRSRVITQQEAEDSAKIIALDEDHLVVGAGDRVYVQGISEESKTNIFSIFRVEKDYIHPETKEFLGIEGLELGKAQLEYPGSTASLILTRSNAEVRIGDQIIEPSQQELDAYFIPKEPQGIPQGLIISVFGGLNQIGQYQVVVITGGFDQFREVGDVLSVMQSQKDMPSRIKHSENYDFPSLKVGKLVVFRVFDKVSYALVMNAKRPIFISDYVGAP